MLSKKAQTSADYISFVVFGILGTFIIMGTLTFIYVPMAEQRIEYKVDVMMTDSKSNLFLTYYLHNNINNKNVADVITTSFHSKDYTELTSVTSSSLNNLFNKKTGWKISIDDDEVAEFCDDSTCKGKSNSYIILLPTKNPDKTIDFKIKIYQK